MNQKITDITMLIQKKHPELSKYLAEMHTTIAMDKNTEVTIEALENYLSSLEALLSKYELQLNQKKLLTKHF